jgi:hypothetical protein
MKIFRDSIGIVQQHKRAFLMLNIVFFGLLVVVMVATVMYPELNESSRARNDPQLDMFPVKQAVEAYANGNVLAAASLTFLINLVVGSILCITVPSFVVPFFGVLFTTYRFLEWGFLFAPLGQDAVAFIPHYVTLIVEGEAYVLAAFATWVHGRMFLQPQRYGLTSRWAGYKEGLLTTLRLYPLIALVLLVVAIYEAIEVIYFVPPLLAR